MTKACWWNSCPAHNYETPGCKGLYREWYWVVCAYQEILFLLRHVHAPLHTDRHAHMHGLQRHVCTYRCLCIISTKQIQHCLFSHLLTTLLRLRNRTICQITLDFTFTEKRFCPKTAHWHLRHSLKTVEFTANDRHKMETSSSWLYHSFLHTVRVVSPVSSLCQCLVTELGFLGWTE